MNYIDAFAGPGVYSGGEPGSPVIAIETALAHSSRPKGRVNFLFIEKDAERAAILTQELTRKFPVGSLPAEWGWTVENGEFATVIEQGLNEIEAKGSQLAPTLAFLDPFGFSGWDLPMRTVARILASPRCEVFVTFMSGFASRFPEVVPPETLNRLFDDNGWQGVTSLSGEARTEFLLRQYERCLRERAGARYTRSFEMRSAQGRVIYNMVFATKHLKGMEAMKEAMWEIDPRGTYRFSDRTDPNQSFLIEFDPGPDPHWVPIAAGLVGSRYAGKTISREEVHDFVVAETAFPDRAATLRRLEHEGLLTVNGRVKNYGYPPGCQLSFKGGRTGG
jgi:three-Cys-motif partner protein